MKRFRTYPLVILSIFLFGAHPLLPITSCSASEQDPQAKSGKSLGFLVVVGDRDGFQAKDTLWATCTGVLIDPTHVVTSASCASYRYDYDPELPVPFRPSELLVGIRSASGDSTVKPIDVREIILHPDFHDRAKGGDVAVLRLKDPIRTRYASLTSPLTSADYLPGSSTTVVEIDEYDQIPELRRLPAELTFRQHCPQTARSKQLQNQVCVTRRIRLDSEVYDCGDGFYGYGIALDTEGEFPTLLAVEGGPAPFCDKRRRTYSPFTKIAPYAEWIRRQTKLEGRIPHILRNLTATHRELHESEVAAYKASADPASMGRSDLIQAKAERLASTLASWNNAIADNKQISQGRKQAHGEFTSRLAGASKRLLLVAGEPAQWEETYSEFQRVSASR